MGEYYTYTVDGEPKSLVVDRPISGVSCDVYRFQRTLFKVFLQIRHSIAIRFRWTSHPVMTSGNKGDYRLTVAMVNGVDDILLQCVL